MESPQELFLKRWSIYVIGNILRNDSKCEFSSLLQYYTYCKLSTPLPHIVWQAGVPNIVIHIEDEAGCNQGGKERWKQRLRRSVWSEGDKAASALSICLRVRVWPAEGGQGSGVNGGHATPCAVLRPVCVVSVLTLSLSLSLSGSEVVQVNLRDD